MSITPSRKPSIREIYNLVKNKAAFGSINANDRFIPKMPQRQKACVANDFQDLFLYGVQLDTFTAKVPSSRKTITERPPNENVDLFRNDITPPSGRTLFRQESTVDKMTGATDRERMPTYCPSPGVFGIVKGEGRNSILKKS
nr:hypothetical protein [Tanacetum cinerariifolium]GFA07129.1 hypothetical protein [Tanacetum cinerariifolium]